MDNTYYNKLKRDCLGTLILFVTRQLYIFKLYKTLKYSESVK